MFIISVYSVYHFNIQNSAHKEIFDPQRGALRPTRAGRDRVQGQLLRGDRA